MPELLTTWYGTFLVDGAAVKARQLVTQDVEAIAARLSAMRSDQVLPEEQSLANQAGPGLVVYEKRLRGIGRYESSAPTAIDFEPKASGYAPRLLHEALLRIAVDEAHMELSDRDRIIVHEVRALDEIVKTANALAERLREWYAVHSPEIVALIRDHADLARLVADSEDRSAVAERVGVSLHASTDGPPAADEAIVRSFAAGLNTLYNTWAEIEKRLEDAMNEVAPNLAAVGGPMLGARLIAAAGGLEKLAIVSSGTVQTLGAENALFRHMKDGSPPPKHGLIFQFEAVNRAPWWVRGKISRALAGKLSIAAKADAFGDDPTRGPVLVEQLRLRIEEITKQFPTAPPKKPRGGSPRGRPRQ